ncbi:MAG: TetR/AcrR family transcriptional regulator [Vicinamibacterales bacterium]
MATPSDTRDRIVYAAMELFWEKGYASTSVADILKAAGANSGSLYHFFPGKQELLLAVLDTYLGGIDEMLLRPIWEGVDDPIDKVFALLGGYRRHLTTTECQYGCPIGYLALELHEPDPPVRERIAANFSQWVERVETCLVDAGDRLPRDLDRRALAHFVLTTMEGAVMQARTYRSIDTFDQSIAQLRRYVTALEAEAKAAVRDTAGRTKATGRKGRSRKR